MTSPPATPLAPGFRFHPTDEELVGYYLKRKVAGLPLAVDAIAEVDLYKWAPWDLPLLSRLRSSDRRWFFFCLLDRKHDGSLRTNRATADGFWKSTGRDRRVLFNEKKIIGMKKSLVFHEGRAPKGRRTGWVMHEYRLEKDERSCMGTSFVVCKVFQKSAIGTKGGAGYGATFIKEEWAAAAQDLVPTTGEASPDVLMIAAAERDERHADDFEQGKTEAMCSIDPSTIGCEASSSNSNPPSKGFFAPGFRFHPTDEELVSYYLKRKVSGLPLCMDAIAEVNLYKSVPWDLPPMSRLSLNILNTEWYFFSTLDRKYPFSTLDRKYPLGRYCHRNNRATAEGYWKITGVDRPVHSCTTNKIIGIKKTLIYYTGRAPGGQRTDWVMHEYRLEEDEHNSKGPSFVLCRIYQKSGVGPQKARALYGPPFIEEELEEAAQDLVPARNALPEQNVIIDTAPTVIINDAREQNCVYASDDFEQGTTQKMYSIGSQVEIAYIRENLPVAWYTATVLKVIDERILLVEYDTLKTEDDTLLSEIVSTQYIRPHTPPTVEVRNFDLLDEVEAFYNGGWWPGVVAKVNAGSRYNVKFMHLEEEIEFNHIELRLLYDWVDGQWIQASQDKSIEPQNLDSPKSVDHVQLLHANNIAPKHKFPDSVIPSSGSGDEAPSTNYGSENLDNSTFQSHWEDLQSHKKAKKGETTQDNTQLLDSRGTITSSEVKMRFDVRTPIIEEEPDFRIKSLVENCRSASPFKKIHVVSADSTAKPATNILSGETTEYPLAPDKSSQELVFLQRPVSTNGEEHTKGRSGKSEFLQTGERGGACGPMVDSQQRKKLVSELDREGDKGARQYTVEENKRMNCRHQKLRNIEPSLEGDSMGNQQGNKVVEPPIEELSAAQCGSCSDNGSEAQQLFNVMTSSSDASLVETSDFSIQSSEAGSEAQNKALLSTVLEQSTKRDLSEKAGDSPPEQSALPFEKCSSIWDSLKSMEVFCVMPQQPHFHPLEQYGKDFREGMAIGLMVTFTNVVNRIGKLELADSRHKFDGILKTLVHLEGHGFDVQSIRARLVELLRLKDNQDRLVDDSSSLKALLRKEKRGELLNVEIESIEKASRGLEQSLFHLHEEKSCISERKREDDSKLDG